MILILKQIIEKQKQQPKHKSMAGYLLIINKDNYINK